MPLQSTVFQSSYGKLLISVLLLAYFSASWATATSTATSVLADMDTLGLQDASITLRHLRSSISAGDKGSSIQEERGFPNFGEYKKIISDVLSILFRRIKLRLNNYKKPEEEFGEIKHKGIDLLKSEEFNGWLKNYHISKTMQDYAIKEIKANIDYEQMLEALSAKILELKENKQDAKVFEKFRKRVETKKVAQDKKAAKSVNGANVANGAIKQESAETSDPVKRTKVAEDAKSLESTPSDLKKTAETTNPVDHTNTLDTNLERGGKSKNGASPSGVIIDTSTNTRSVDPNVVPAGESKTEGPPNSGLSKGISSMNKDSATTSADVIHPAMGARISAADNEKIVTANELKPESEVNLEKLNVASINEPILLPRIRSDNENAAKTVIPNVKNEGTKEAGNVYVAGKAVPTTSESSVSNPVTVETPLDLAQVDKPNSAKSADKTRPAVTNSADEKKQDEPESAATLSTPQVTKATTDLPEESSDKKGYLGRIRNRLSSLLGY